MNGRRGSLRHLRPVGGGKDALIDRLLSKDPNLRRSVSFTTRQPRANEKDGVDYSFVRATSSAPGRGRQMLEHAGYDGNLYGTSRRAGETSCGRPASTRYLKIDVKGAHSRGACPTQPLSSCRRPRWPELVRRTASATPRARGTVGAGMIAETEMKYASHYDHVVVNDDLDRRWMRCSDHSKGARPHLDG